MGQPQYLCLEIPQSFNLKLIFLFPKLFFSKYSIVFEIESLGDFKLLRKELIWLKEFWRLKKKKNQIVDQKRIRFILKNIKKKSIRNNIDPKITQKIWKNMIYAYIDFERRNFKKKKLLTVRR